MQEDVRADIAFLLDQSEITNISLFVIYSFNLEKAKELSIESAKRVLAL
ncbi:MAG: hypothetical protein KGY67_00775 [Candidatus Thermoplasmatota archaeon]|nr:hypothetical protein [Candidatus Thermoplasmatota archaeon]